MKKKHMLKYLTDEAEMRVSRDPVSAKLPSYPQDFLAALRNKKMIVTDAMFATALDDRLKAENSSYTEKQADEAILKNQRASKLKDIHDEECQVLDFLEYVNGKKEGKHHE